MPLIPIAERLWSKVAKTDADGCWLWTGATREKGYGCLKVNGRVVSAHRLAYELTFGAIPVGRMVLHHCDVPACCRPDHLFLGDNSANMRDASAKGRLYRPGIELRGERHPQARLTIEQVGAIRKSGASSRALARVYSVSDRTIRNIRQNKKWKAA